MKDGITCELMENLKNYKMSDLHLKDVRMEIAIEAMKALLAKDFKNIGFSAFNNSKQNPASYIADQSFILADAMIERENKKEETNEEK